MRLDRRRLRGGGSRAPPWRGGVGIMGNSKAALDDLRRHRVVKPGRLAGLIDAPCTQEGYRPHCGSLFAPPNTMTAARAAVSVLARLRSGVQLART